MNCIHYLVHGQGGNGCNAPLTPEGIQQTERQREFLTLHFLMMAGLMAKVAHGLHFLILSGVIPKVVHGIGACERQMIGLLELQSHPLQAAYIVGDGYHKPVDPGMAKKFLATLPQNTVILGNRDFLRSITGVKAINYGDVWSICYYGPDSLGFFDHNVPDFFQRPI